MPTWMELRFRHSQWSRCRGHGSGRGRGQPTQIGPGCALATPSMRERTPSGSFARSVNVASHVNVYALIWLIDGSGEYVWNDSFCKCTQVMQSKYHECRELIRFESGSNGDDDGSLGIEVSNAASGYKGGFIHLFHWRTTAVQVRFFSV